MAGRDWTNPPLTPPRRGTAFERWFVRSPPWRGRGWVGSSRVKAPSFAMLEKNRWRAERWTDSSASCVLFNSRCRAISSCPALVCPVRNTFRRPVVMPSKRRMSLREKITPAKHDGLTVFGNCLIIFGNGETAKQANRAKGRDAPPGASVSNAVIAVVLCPNSIASTGTPSGLEGEIDELVYALYGLTKEEKALVQAAAK